MDYNLIYKNLLNIKIWKITVYNFSKFGVINNDISYIKTDYRNHSIVI